MVHGGMSIVKYLLFVFNFIFVVSGIALIAIGAVVQTNGRSYTEFLGSKFVTLPNLVIAVGVIILIVAFLGCCGAVKENYCMVMSFGVLLFLIFVIELGGGIAAYVYRNQFKDFVEKNMEDSLAQMGTKNDTAALWDEMQDKLKCCGVKNADDWKSQIPGSCCGHTGTRDYICNKSVDEIYKDGCLDALETFMQHKIVMVGGAAIGVGVIELLGVIFACCLANAIKKEYEGV